MMSLMNFNCELENFEFSGIRAFCGPVGGCKSPAKGFWSGVATLLTEPEPYKDLP